MCRALLLLEQIYLFLWSPRRIWQSKTSMYELVFVLQTSSQIMCLTSSHPAISKRHSFGMVMGLNIIFKKHWLFFSLISSDISADLQNFMEAQMTWTNEMQTLSLGSVVFIKVAYGKFVYVNNALDHHEVVNFSFLYTRLRVCYFCIHSILPL